MKVNLDIEIAKVRLRQARSMRGVVVAGIWPLASYRNAVFMKNEVPGVVVPDSILERMAAVPNRDDQLKVGIEIARESVARIRDRVAGIQVSAPLGKIANALAVMEE